MACWILNARPSWLRRCVTRCSQNPNAFNESLMAYRILLLALVLTGCSAWNMKTPENFDAEPASVSGSSKNLVFGGYALVGFQRDWTRGSGVGLNTISSEKRSQKYEFGVARGAAFSIRTQCEFTANEKKMALRGDWDFVLG